MGEKGGRQKAEGKTISIWDLGEKLKSSAGNAITRSLDHALT